MVLQAVRRASIQQPQTVCPIHRQLVTVDEDQHPLQGILRIATLDGRRMGQTVATAIHGPLSKANGINSKANSRDSSGRSFSTDGRRK
jgi:hypothetical protein